VDLGQVLLSEQPHHILLHWQRERHHGVKDRGIHVFDLDLIFCERPLELFFQLGVEELRSPGIVWLDFSAFGRQFGNRVFFGRCQTSFTFPLTFSELLDNPDQITRLVFDRFEVLAHESTGNFLLRGIPKITQMLEHGGVHFRSLQFVFCKRGSEHVLHFQV